MPKVVKVKILDFEVATLASERRADRPSIVGEDLTVILVRAISTGIVCQRRWKKN